jgi:hypothetical protein
MHLTRKCSQMKNLSVYLLLIAAIVGVCIMPVAAEIPPGGTGWLAFKTNINGASVYIDGIQRGTTDTAGEFDIPWDPSFTSYSVTKRYYNDVSGAINFPKGSTNVDIPVMMYPNTVGNGIGYFRVHTNIDGATVSFSGQIMGITTNQFFTLPVATTADLFRSFSVSKPGYLTYDAPLSRNPESGEIIDLYATLNRLPSPTPAPTLIGGSAGWFAIHSNVEGASVSFDNQDKGRIENGVLNVMVYTTGTPYQTYSVSANGYGTVTGPLPASPAEGQVRDIYVTLNPLSAETVPPVGSGIGTIAVYANVEGAKVYFDNDYQGSITNGVLLAPIHVTATPYQAYRVEAPGYTTVTGSITERPAAGETVSIRVTLYPALTPTPASAAPLPAFIVFGAVIGAGAIVVTAGNRKFR